jgi:hypothetical protein
MPTIAIPAPAPTDADPFADCPPWCAREPEWHENPDHLAHDGPFVVVPTGANDELCSLHSLVPGIDPGTVSLCLERDDKDGLIGEPRLWLSTDMEAAHLSIDRAEQLARAILARVAEAREALQVATQAAAAAAVAA